LKIITSINKRSRKTNENKPYKKATKKSLKENPQPSKVPSNNQEQMEMEPESETNSNNKGNENQKETEALNHLYPSFINEPSIEEAKRRNKKERAKEIKELAKEIQLPSEKKVEKSNKENITKKIKNNRKSR